MFSDEAAFGAMGSARFRSPGGMRAAAGFPRFQDLTGDMPRHEDFIARYCKA